MSGPAAAPKPATPWWSLASLELPFLAMFTARTWGDFLDAVLPLTGICLAGLALAAIGLVRGERPLWLAILAVLANAESSPRS